MCRLRIDRGNCFNGKGVAGLCGDVRCEDAIEIQNALIRSKEKTGQDMFRSCAPVELISACLRIVRHAYKINR